MSPELSALSGEVPLTLGQKVARAVTIALVLVGFGLAAWKLSFLLGPIALSFVAFYSLNPLVNLLENRNLSRGRAVAIVFTGLVVVLAFVLVSVWMSLEDWLRQAPSADGPSIFEVRLSERLGEWQAALSARYPQIGWSGMFGQVSEHLQELRRKLTVGLPERVMGAASGAGLFALAPVIAFFLLLDGAAMQRALFRHIPNKYFETSVLLLHRVDRQIAGYLRGTAAQAGVIIALTTISLWIVGMPDSILFGLIFGIINVIPFVGPLIGAAIGLMYALVEPNAPELWVLITVYGVVHLIDVALVTPWVVGKSIDLHPLAVILGLTIGGSLAGIIGMLVSMPLLAVAKVIGSTLIEAWRKNEISALR